MNSLINARNACVAFAAAFIGAGLLGFIPNPLVARDGLFAVNALHNLVHVVTGAGFLLGGLTLGRPQLTLRAIGALYVAVAALGFATTGDTLLGMIHINEADRWLHLALAAVILGAGFAVPASEPPSPAEGHAA
ncbi:MAG: DUF4383 domain-containing protein [Rhodospirillales bacterium]|nr:DUF4383 domain-containing protein [Rhodospirillales bacterium]